MADAIVGKVQERVRKLNEAPVRQGARHVLYWAQMNRRVPVNQALEHAAEQANLLGLPLLVYEGLGCTYEYANDRLHTFVVEGVPDTEQRLKARGIGYCFYLRKRKTDANDILYKLAADAALVVTDDYPVFIAPIHNASVPEKIGVAYHAVDASCIVPMSRIDKRNYGAYTIRPRINKMLAEYLVPLPEVKMKRAWTDGHPEWHVKVTPKNVAELVAACEIDHSIAPSLSFHGGQSEAERLLDHFLQDNLRTYAKDRNEPSKHATSHMSPYLHFGAISSLHVALRAKEFAEEHRLVASEYLEELIVRRELAFNFARHTPDVQTLEALPEWCLKTMAKHAKDKRDPVYTAEQMERGETYDDLWNATQKEMLLRGKVHGYYRMYWGKKIIEWSPTYDDALKLMIYLHDRYCLDGRDPNTYTNILWCFGLHDRPWGERPIFGQLRYMSYDGMKRKTDIAAYIDEVRNDGTDGKGSDESMKCIVSGGRGFIGRRVVDSLLRDGHYVATWSRTPARETRDAVGAFYWDPLGPEPSEESLTNYDAVIHLAGEPVAQRWTAEAKQKIRDSRVLGTKRLVDAIGKVEHKPSVLVCASAIGYYGSRGDEELDETSAGGSGFLADTCRDWEQEADRAMDLGLRVVKVRIGVVLGPDGGALAAMLPAFRAFLGGRMGDGRQWMSWIHVEDLAEMMKWAVESEAAGAVNGVAPAPVRNAEFTGALGNALGRPAFLQVPAALLRAGMGEMSEAVLSSARVLPKVAAAHGFQWKHRELEQALRDCVK